MRKIQIIGTMSIPHVASAHNFINCKYDQRYLGPLSFTGVTGGLPLWPGIKVHVTGYSVSYADNSVEAVEKQLSHLVLLAPSFNAIVRVSELKDKSKVVVCFRVADGQVMRDEQPGEFEPAPVKDYTEENEIEERRAAE